MDSSDTPTPESDPLTASDTVRFLGRELKAEQHRLHGLIKVRKSVEKRAERSRGIIKNLQVRIQRELDQNPTIFREFRRTETETDGSED